MHKMLVSKRFVRRKLRKMQRNAFEKGLNSSFMKQLYFSTLSEDAKTTKRNVLVGMVTFCIFMVLCATVWLYFSVAERCLLPSNYLVWEVTRPLADCAYCENVTKPIVLRNVTRHSFTTYAYSSKPLIVKNAISHWRARKAFSYDLFKRLYHRVLFNILK